MRLFRSVGGYVMANAKQLQYILIDEWHDCYINENKQRGYVATIDLSKIKYPYAYIRFWGLNDKEKLVAYTDGSLPTLTNVFLSLNAFNGESKKAKDITQIRNIGIDLDCYKLGIDANEAAEQLQQLIFAGSVPNPNLLIRSGNGLQLIYSIAGGLPPTKEIKWLVMYVTNELSALLEPLGADYASNTLERVFRLPGTFNAKPGKPKRLVTVEIWNHEECTLDSLLAYCKPIERSKKTVQARKSNGELKYFDLTQVQGMTTRTLNAGRMNDMLRLVQIRNGAIEARNIFTYDYAFLMSLLTDNESSVLGAAYQINDKFDDPQKSKVVERTARNAFKDGRTFWKAFEENEYKTRGLPKELIKPKQTRTLIKQHSITLDEQRELSTLISKEVREERRTETRRKNGVKSRKEYEENRKAASDEKLEKLRELLNENPKLSQRKAALILGCSTKTIQRLRQKL